MPRYLLSELPKRGEARQHWIVLLVRKPHKANAVILIVLALFGFLGLWYFPWIAAAVALVMAFLRISVWRAERVILTGKRIIHVQGVPETTRTEASLRLDRISGLRLIETPVGRLLHYGTIEVEAPGEHPGLKRLYRITHPMRFYLQLRDIVFAEPPRAHDPDDGVDAGANAASEFDTAELPRLGQLSDQLAGRRDWLGRRLG